MPRYDTDLKIPHRRGDDSQAQAVKTGVEAVHPHKCGGNAACGSGSMQPEAVPPQAWEQRLNAFKPKGSVVPLGLLLATPLFFW